MLCMLFKTHRNTGKSAVLQRNRGKKAKSNTTHTHMCSCKGSIWQRSDICEISVVTLSVIKLQQKPEEDQAGDSNTNHSTRRAQVKVEQDILYRQRKYNSLLMKHIFRKRHFVCIDLNFKITPCYLLTDVSVFRYLKLDCNRSLDNTSTSFRPFCLYFKLYFVAAIFSTTDIMMVMIMKTAHLISNHRETVRLYTVWLKTLKTWSIVCCIK